jgi:Nucleoside-diphosphate-sugar pyrophosphorylase involved in lipopolysaccharide biosynthesis/translation initiation factor 2B, gamma/epsilon subunits (eIF-2Bgamma/eIF-2Bepsilon)
MLITVWTLQELAQLDKIDTRWFLMAGGLGSRLGELTRDCPKPLLHVGGKPILEIIINNLASAGFYKLWLAVNYKAEMVKVILGTVLNGELKLNICEKMNLSAQQGLSRYFQNR